MTISRMLVTAVLIVWFLLLTYKWSVYFINTKDYEWNGGLFLFTMWWWMFLTWYSW